MNAKLLCSVPAGLFPKWWEKIERMSEPQNQAGSYRCLKSHKEIILTVSKRRLPCSLITMFKNFHRK